MLAGQLCKTKMLITRGCNIRTWIHSTFFLFKSCCLIRVYTVCINIRISKKRGNNKTNQIPSIGNGQSKELRQKSPLGINGLIYRPNSRSVQNAQASSIEHSMETSFFPLSKRIGRTELSGFGQFWSWSGMFNNWSRFFSMHGFCAAEPKHLFYTWHTLHNHRKSIKNMGELNIHMPGNMKHEKNARQIFIWSCWPLSSQILPGFFKINFLLMPWN